MIDHAFFSRAVVRNHAASALTTNYRLRQSTIYRLRTVCLHAETYSPHVHLMGHSYPTNASHHSLDLLKWACTTSSQSMYFYTPVFTHWLSRTSCAELILVLFSKPPQKVLSGNVFLSSGSPNKLKTCGTLQWWARLSLSLLLRATGTLCSVLMYVLSTYTDDNLGKQPPLSRRAPYWAVGLCKAE